MTACQQLCRLFKAEYEIATQLLKVLTGERSVLMAIDADKVQQAVVAKQPLIIQLEQLSKQRERLLTASGFPAGKAGLTAFIDNQTAEDKQALMQWVKRTKAVARQCQESNQINGGIVNVNRQYLYRAMGVLRGKDTVVAAYGPGGEYTHQVVRQPLIGRV